MGALRKAIQSLLDLAGLDAGRTVWGSRGLPKSGYTMLPHDWHDHIYRVTGGQQLQLSLLLYCWRLTAGVCSEGDTVQEWSPWVKKRALVDKLGCECVDSIDDALENGQARGLWRYDDSRRGEVRISLLPANWPKMKPCKKCSRIHLVGGQCVGLHLASEKKLQPLKPLNGVVYGRPFTFKKGKEQEFTLDKPAERIRLSFREGDGMVARFGVSESGAAAIEFWQEKTETKGLTPPVSGVHSGKTNPVVQQIAEGIGTYGPVTIPAITRMIAASHAEPEKVLQSLSVVKPPENAENPVGWILSMVPRYFAGAYKPKKPEKRVSERDQRALNAMRGIYGKEGKIA